MSKEQRAAFQAWWESDGVGLRPHVPEDQAYYIWLNGWLRGLERAQKDIEAIIKKEETGV